MSAGDWAGAILLDTCAMIWLANGDPIKGDAPRHVETAVASGGMLVSPISGWEIGMLSRRTARSNPFPPDAANWLSRFMRGPGVRAAPFTHEIALAASWLPEPLHSDPADRLLIATARALGVPLVTRDSKILDYGAAGHVAVIAC